MDALFLNSKNRKTSDPHKLLPNYSNKIDLKRSDKYVALSNLNEEFESPDGSYSVADIQDLLSCIFKKHETVTDNPSTMIHVNKIENRITFKIKAGYYLQRLRPETTKLLGRSKSKITKDENDENSPHLEITDVVLVHCNIVNNDYQHDSRFLYTFVHS